MTKKKLAAYYTPDDVAEYICLYSIVPYILDRKDILTHNLDAFDVFKTSMRSDTLRKIMNLSVLDPSCGDGALLLAAKRVISKLLSIYCDAFGIEYSTKGLDSFINAKILHGMDISQAAVDNTVQLLGESSSKNILVGNSLLYSWNRTFDVIIGNPPYLEEREAGYIVEGFQTKNCKAIHGFFVEKALQLSHSKSYVSMIMPMSLISTQRMTCVRDMIETRGVCYSNYSWRPGKLFDDVNRAITIFISFPGKDEVYTTGYIKWKSSNRKELFKNLSYTYVGDYFKGCGYVGKISNKKDISILDKLKVCANTVSDITGCGCEKVFYKTTGGLYWKVFTNFAPKFTVNGVEQSSSREAALSVVSEDEAKKLVALLSSSLFWWWYTITSTLRDLNPSDIKNFPLPDDWDACSNLVGIGEAYLKDIVENSCVLKRNQKTKGETCVQSFKISKSKAIIDSIDKELAKHYGLTEEEVNYVINYDLGFRLGGEND